MSQEGLEPLATLDSSEWSYWEAEKIFYAALNF